MKRTPKKIWVTAVVVLVIGLPLFIHNRPVELREAVLMSTPVIFRDGSTTPYDALPEDIAPPVIDLFYATDRQPTDASLLHPLFYGNDRSMTLSLGRASVRFGSDGMSWRDVEKATLTAERPSKIPLKIVEIEKLHEIGSASQLIEDSIKKDGGDLDPFLERIQRRLSKSSNKTIVIFVPGFKVDFAYPVLVAAELWHYLGYPGAFVAYSWPSRQRVVDYLADVETASYTAQHFRMLLVYLALHTDAERIHILAYSAGARVVSQALHELRLMAYGHPVSRMKNTLKIGQVLFTAPDIDMMLFTARYRDGFEELADRITIYTNANDTALNWALRFLGWPRLGAPGELALTPEEARSISESEHTVIIDVAAAENASSGNGHGYFIKSPWVSTDLLLTIKHGASPRERGLSKQNDGLIWKFPQNYPVAVHQAMTPPP